ncbi:hypothetical protein SCHPADRAFT_220539 [Schizopora paradoxa]|uniref:Uncharacterized protein n=1 Tax=Schizopora paradoxa TaxID=27342 RepID=A0A0H2S3A4_9AGAM|nr:hypothetical protein SCHPADRAFT_220539 [Schizopora paradoxa]
MSTTDLPCRRCSCEPYVTALCSNVQDACRARPGAEPLILLTMMQSSTFIRIQARSMSSTLNSTMQHFQSIKDQDRLRDGRDQSSNVPSPTIFRQQTTGQRQSWSDSPPPASIDRSSGSANGLALRAKRMNVGTLGRRNTARFLGRYLFDTNVDILMPAPGAIRLYSLLFFRMFFTMLKTSRHDARWCRCGHRGFMHF